MNFQKVIYKNVEKKFISQQTYLTYHRHFEVLFCAYCKGLFLSLKNSHYAYIPLYMHKTFSTLGNEKEQ